MGVSCDYFGKELVAHRGALGLLLPHALPGLVLLLAIIFLSRPGTQVMITALLAVMWVQWQPSFEWFCLEPSCCYWFLPGTHAKWNLPKGRRH